jgi:hypothetical protein
METRNYLLSEKGSYEAFAVIEGVLPLAEEGNIDLINKVGLAVEENYCLEERVKVVHGSVSKVNETIFISFRMLDEIEEEEVRDFELNLVAIY